MCVSSPSPEGPSDPSVPEQLEEEFKGCLDLAKYCLGTVGLLDKCTSASPSGIPPTPTTEYVRVPRAAVGGGPAGQWAGILDDLGVNYYHRHR